MSFFKLLLGKPNRTYTWEQYCNSPVLMELPEEARQFLFVIKIYPDEAEAFFFLTVRVLYIEFKKTPHGPALAKLCQTARAKQLKIQQLSPRSAALATATSTSSTSAAIEKRHSTKSGKRRTAHEVLAEIEHQLISTATESSSTANAIVSSEVQLSSSMKRSHRLSSDDIILKSSGRSSSSPAVEALIANMAAAAAAAAATSSEKENGRKLNNHHHAVTSDGSTLTRSSSPSSTDSLEGSTSGSSTLPVPTATLPAPSSANEAIVNFKPIPLAIAATPASRSTSPVASSPPTTGGKPQSISPRSGTSSSPPPRPVTPLDTERDAAKLKERERIRKKLKRGAKSKIRASASYVPPTQDLIASVVIKPLPKSSPNPPPFEDPVTQVAELFIRENPQGHLRKFHKIGQGRFGNVYTALNSTGTKVAVKAIKSYYSESEEEIAREIWMLKTSAHPNVVAFHNAFLFENRVWITMEYCEHGSITSLIKPKSLREKHIAFITSEVLVALQYLHGMNRIHRDLKGENILVAADGNLKLADFGLTMQIDDEHPGLGVAGSRYWIAPEMVLKQPYTTAADIWSLGCVVFELFAGGPPYCEYDTIKAWFRTLTRGPAKLPSACKASPQLDSFLAKCLTVDPDERATATELLSHPFLAKACTKQELNKLLLTSEGEQALYNI